MLSEDVISRVVKGTELVTKRLITKTNRMPKWGNLIFGHNNHHVCVVEESLVDPVRKTFTIYTRNIGYTKFMVRGMNYDIIFYTIFTYQMLWSVFLYLPMLDVTRGDCATLIILVVNRCRQVNWVNIRIHSIIFCSFEWFWEHSVKITRTPNLHWSEILASSQLKSWPDESGGIVLSFEQ